MTDGDLIRNLRLDDPRPFFKELLTKMYRKRTVLSPHFYGMTVTNNTHTGHALWEKFTQSWGKLQVGVGRGVGWGWYEACGAAGGKAQGECVLPCGMHAGHTSSPIWRTRILRECVCVCLEGGVLCHSILTVWQQLGPV